MPKQKRARKKAATRPATQRGTRRKNEVHVLASHPRSVRWGGLVATLARQFLRTLRLSGTELSIALVSDPAIRTLNKAWRKKDQATDVLSFPAGELPGAGSPMRVLGDVVISLDTAVRRAREEGTKLTEELALYLAHGVLHLLGHDHHAPGQSKKMERWEKRLLGSAGMIERTRGHPQAGKASRGARKRRDRARKE